MQFRITQYTINKGKPGHMGCCAGALCINRVLNPTYRAYVTSSTIDIYDEANNLKWYSLATPRILREFIETYDRNKKEAKPTTFTLNIPKKYLKDDSNTRKRGSVRNTAA